MRLLGSDPDIETIVSRIKAGDIDLQPDFQRGEVWSRSKKQRLIDSILREWHVPPIHVIEHSSTRKHEVLDGQQRLAAIRDFVDGEFSLDTEIEPIDESLASLHGKKYRDLPEEWKRRFNQFTIRLFRLVDYLPSEPGELFFRLNQPTSLTGAEQRNAFFGPVRIQIKELVKTLEINNLGKEYFGFSNARMAYDDVLSRVALTIERGTLETKIRSSDLIEIYRTEEPLNSQTTQLIYKTLDILSKSREYTASKIKFNKATLSTWMLFIIRNLIENNEWITPRNFADFVDHFENERVFSPLGLINESDKINQLISHEWIFNVYESRSTARVADVSSVLLRDVTLWILLHHYVNSREAIGPIKTISRLSDTLKIIKNTGAPLEDDYISRLLIDSNWGRL